METKKEIRKKLLRKRSALSKEECSSFSDAITDKVIRHAWFQNAETIYCYMSYNNEVDTIRLILEAFSLGKRVAVPKVLGQEMEFYYIQSLEDVIPGCKGILEPKDENTQLAKDETALMILPLVGYDNQNNRLGYGGGYYDRYLQKHPKHPTMGIAFTLQKVETLPVEPTDRTVNIIVTE